MHRRLKNFLSLSALLLTACASSMTNAIDRAAQVPELRNVAGIDILGYLPGDLHMVTVFVAGVETASKNDTAAQAFIAFFQSPQAKALFRAKGLDPA